MIENPEIGRVYWTCEPSIESEGSGKRCPWHGKVTKIHRLVNSAVGHALICAFDAETGEPDDDPNASAYAVPAALWATKYEALTAYRDYLKEHVETAVSALMQVETELGILRALG